MVLNLNTFQFTRKHKMNSFSINTKDKPLQFNLSNGETITFVGANGTGKSRLAAQIEESLAINAHRISAHRSLIFRNKVQRITKKDALEKLRIGSIQGKVSSRFKLRWGRNAPTHLLDDFEYLLEALFADSISVALEIQSLLEKQGTISKTKVKKNKLSELCNIWHELLPHRKLIIEENEIIVTIPNSDIQYPPSDMSDGERGIFYLIGQVILAKEDSVLIIDEPELHIHKSILSKLWNVLESNRTDCAFIYITHDLDFAATRVGKKFVLENYLPNETWELSIVPENDKFDERVITRILGSRNPILFVEGSHHELDYAIYSNCFPDWEVIPWSSSSEVKNIVKSIQTSNDFNRIVCKGIIDLDDNEQDDINEYLKHNIHVTKVSEIENFILLPNILNKLIEEEDYIGDESQLKFQSILDKIFASITQEKINLAVERYQQRRLNRILSQINIPSDTAPNKVTDIFIQQFDSNQIEKLVTSRKNNIKRAIADKNLPEFLQYYDDKGLLAIVSKELKNCDKKSFKEWIKRVLKGQNRESLIQIMQSELPQITV